MSSYPNMPEQTGPMTYGQVGTRSNGFAVAGLVCGIIGLFLFNVVLGPLAIIFGGIAISRARNGGAHRRMAAWAIGLGIADLVVFVLLLAVAARHGGFYIH